MRTPLEDALHEHPEWSEARDRHEAKANLEAVFLAARQDANAYSAERLSEIYQIAERALTFASAFEQLPATRSPMLADRPWYRRIPRLIVRYGSGLLLAACAPLVADSSVALAVGCAIAAVLTLALTRVSQDSQKKKNRIRPKDTNKKFESLISAADRSLQSATAPAALEHHPSEPLNIPQDDVFSLLQDVLAAGAEHTELQALAENAERLAARGGYKILWEPNAQDFQVMVDPHLERDILLKPALIHQSAEGQNVLGVLVRGRPL